MLHYEFNRLRYLKLKITPLCSPFLTVIFDYIKRNIYLPLYIYHGDGKGEVGLKIRFEVF